MWLRLRRLVRILGRDALVLWFACRNPATPLWTKLAALLLALYVLSPIDLITDLLPLIGWMDDVALVAFGIPLLLRLLPQTIRSDAEGMAAQWLSRWKLGRSGSPLSK
jgi:uncharacterized membrane protein YkvA (DUF1232 family)